MLGVRSAPPAHVTMWVAAIASSAFNVLAGGWAIRGGSMVLLGTDQGQ
jgi:hypothetical protein